MRKWENARRFNYDAMRGSGYSRWLFSPSQAIARVRQRVKQGGHHAAYSPFCDAMFVDKEIGHFASQRELQNELNGKARIFSLRKESKNAFIDYLALIESEASAEHLRVVNEVYGDGWATPFVELLSHK